MMVIGYTLECGQDVELIVASDQVREDHILGDVRTWCPRCDTEHRVTRVQLRVG